MTTIRIVPCLDTAGGRVVKGVRFSALRDAGDPVERALDYQAQGADELVLLDVSATPEGRGHAVETVKRVREVLSIPLIAGGGVRSTEDAALLLEAGADQVSVNTAAVERPPILTEIAARFGSQCAVLALDAARAEPACTSARVVGRGFSPGGQRSPGNPSWEVVTRSGRERTGIDAVRWACEAVDAGAGEILLTSFDRDGTRSGYDLELLTAIASTVRVPVIASGGAAEPRHLLEAIRAGADAVLAASIFHDGDYTVGDLKRFLLSNGVEVRL